MGDSSNNNNAKPRPKRAVASRPVDYADTAQTRMFANFFKSSDAVVKKKKKSVVAPKGKGKKNKRKTKQEGFDGFRENSSSDSNFATPMWPRRRKLKRMRTTNRFSP